MPNDSPPLVVVRRAYQIYLYAVCFVTVLVVLFAFTEAIYSLVRIVAPGTTGGGDVGAFRGSGERDAGVAALIRSVILGGAAAFIFAFHWGKSVEARGELEQAVTPPAPPPAPEAPTPKRAPRRSIPS